jgi:hypothetical protein
MSFVLLAVGASLFLGGLGIRRPQLFRATILGAMMLLAAGGIQRYRTMDLHHRHLCVEHNADSC